MDKETDKKENGVGILEFLETHGLRTDGKIDERMMPVTFETKARGFKTNF